MFVLVLNFLWRKIETLIGKGLEISTILELFLYAAAGFVPLALPLTILLASIMTMGNFGERSELTAMKSVGIPLWRVFRPLIVLSVIFAIIAFYFASFVIPSAELRTKQIASDIKDKKPAINIRAKEFYNDISNYVIRVDEKNEADNRMYGILIYDHSDDMGNTEVIKADSGYMYSTENNQTLVFKLFSGEVFKEDISGQNYTSRPLTRIRFEEQIMRFDVSNFALQKSEKDRYSDNYKVINIRQLYHQIDSLEAFCSDRKNNYLAYIESRLNIQCKNGSQAGKAEVLQHDFYKDFSDLDEELKTRSASYSDNILADLYDSYKTNLDIEENDGLYITKHKIELYRKYTLSLACIILFFIGASLGAIIRKGGLGMPVVVSIISFTLYFTIGTIGESAAKSGTLSAFTAMWMSSFIFLPLGLLLTVKATSDSKIFSFDSKGKLYGFVSALFKRVVNKNDKK